MTFESLPVGWVSASIRMDEIWTPLRMHGFNHYAFGGPVPPHEFASRSDPSSEFYQAWLGVYTINGGRELFRSGNEDEEFSQLSRVAELDQRAWLEGMGDPRPLAERKHKPTKTDILIDGAKRPLFLEDMDSHSDLGETSTQVSKQLGRPEAGNWKKVVDPYDNLLLHCYYSFWYDEAHNTTIVIYGVSSSFREKTGTFRDNGPALNPVLVEKMKSILIQGN